MKRTFVGIGSIAIVIGIAVLAYPGPGRAFVRGHVGDVAATMLVYAVASFGWAWLVERRWVRAMPRIAVRACVAMGFATAVELVQVWWHARSAMGHLLVGSTFDPFDLVAYAVGVVIAASCERVAHRGDRRC